MFILMMSLFLSCFREQTSDKAEVYKDEFYCLLNDLIRMRLINTSVIQSETIPISKAMWKELAMSLDTNRALDGSALFTLGGYESRATKRLDSADIQYMYDAIDRVKTIQIDSAKVVVPLVATQKLKAIFSVNNRKVGYKVIKEIYGTSCHISVSTPLFNSDYTRVIVWVDYSCGWKEGAGHIFILEKRKDLWWLIEDIGTWVS